MKRTASAPVQAYLFANLITVFQFWGDILALLTSFWCLMVVALAASVGISYFALSWASTLLSAVSHLESCDYNLLNGR